MITGQQLAFKREQDIEKLSQKELKILSDIRLQSKQEIHIAFSAAKQQ